MDKEAIDYGFKAFPDRDAAVDLIANGNDFDSQIALQSMTNTDYDYGFTYKNRDPLKNLDRRGLRKAIESSDGFIEEHPGYTRVPDVYATPEGAAAASAFIKGEILPKYKHLGDDIESSIRKELEYKKKIGALQEKYNDKKLRLQSKIEDSILNYETSRGAGPLGRLRGKLSQISGDVTKIRAGLNDSTYRHNLDRYKEKMSDVPDSVQYARFADAIDESLQDKNELYSFRFY